MNGETTAGESATLASVVSRLAGLLRSGAISSGDLAALRRMDPRSPAPAFFKIEGRVLGESLPADSERRMDAETRWAAIICGLAWLGNLHNPGQRLGSALVDARYSELRFVRLVRADADRLADDLPALARFLASKAVSADWTAAARLILSTGRSDEEPVRRHLARDYYGALSHQENR